jgi:anti-anti-sigma factor
VRNTRRDDGPEGPKSDPGKEKEMTITWEKDPELGDVVHVHPDGRMDAHGADPFFDEVGALCVPEHPSMLLDMRKVEHVSSAGVGVMIRLLSRVRQAGGSLAVYGCTPRVESVFRVVYVDAVINLCKTEEEARVWLRDMGKGEE